MGLYNVQDSEPLKTWLVKNLDAISDADPTALAKYILELLNMWTNDPESQVKSRLSEELEDFLQGEATPFVDRLLATLRSKSYLPYSAMADAPNSFNKQSRGRKRSLEQDEQEMSQERDLKGPPKGPRIHNDRGTRRIPDAPRAHHQRANGREPGHFRDRSHGPPNTNGPNFAGPGGMGLPNQRERCNDYYNFGVCNRGAACPYSHGDDAMISNGLPFVPPIPPAMAMQMLNGLFPPAWQAGFMGPTNGPPAPYDPLYGPPGVPLQAMQGAGNDSVIQDLTPREPRAHRQAQFQPPTDQTPDGADNTAMEDVHTSEETTGRSDRRTNHDRPAHSGRGFGSRGGRPEKMNRSSVVDPNSLTIVVEKLPPEKTNIQDLTAYFSRFGTVTNVAVDRRGNRALVSFSTHQEAHAAWKSEEAVFGNRFVVIFWHRPAPGGGTAGQKALEASATTIQKINAVAGGGTEDTVMADSEPTQRKPDPHPAAAAGPARKPDPKSPQELYEYASRIWMEKMKAAMDVLQSTTASESEKQEAKTKFNILKAQKPAPPPAAKPADPAPLKKGENLDLDLDMLANGQGQTLTQEEAQQTIAKLQALAAEQGLDPNELEEEETRMSHHAFGGYRGRGRGRGWRGPYRGRGRGAVMAMASASLDNRSKRISLRGYDKDGVTDDDALDSVQNHYMPTGQVESVEKGEPGEIIISYPTRASAELAIRSGVPQIEGLGSLSMQWHSQTKPKANGEHTTAPSTGSAYADTGPHIESWGAKRGVRGGGDDDDGQEGWGA